MNALVSKDCIMSDSTCLIELERINRLDNSATTLMKGTPVLLDDKKARRIAAQFDLPIIGTVGLLLKAKRERAIDALCPVLDALELAEFRIAPALRRYALELADEA